MAVMFSLLCSASYLQYQFINSGNQTIAAGASGYFIIAVDIAAAASIGNTVKINGATNPVTFGFTTSPVVANNQTDAAGEITITVTLPLSLVRFTGTATNTAQVQLLWETAQEINTKDFEVEWSNSGLHFTKIATIAAAGNSSQTLHYSYLHTQPGIGDNFYRLKMVDIDGRFTYSPVIVINRDASVSSLKVFPNPVTDILQLYIQSEKRETIVYRLYSADGKFIAFKKAELVKGSNLLSWNIQQLMPGNYFLSNAGNRFETIKIIKQ